VTVRTGVGLVDRHPHRRTGERVGERQLDLNLDVAAALRRGAVAGPTAAIEQATEQVAQVEVGAGAREIEALRTACPRPKESYCLRFSGSERMS
jgi:hypothetical protein